MSKVTQDSTEVTIRPARPEDLVGLARVAGRDSSALPTGRLLLAEVGSTVRAAISLEDGTFVADPFHPTTALVEMLRIRAAAVRMNAAPAAAPRKRLEREPVAVGRAA